MANRKENHSAELSARLADWLDGIESLPNCGFLVARQPQCRSPECGPENGALIFSGSFNPLHAGHLEMARIAATKYNSLPTAAPATQFGEIADCWFEISNRNVDKTTINATELSQRLGQNFGPHGVVVTAAARFTEKAGLFHGATFIVGADTILRFADLQYHGNDQSQLDAAIGQIARQQCRFLVFGRKTGKEFVDRRNIMLPEPLFELCSFIDSSQFAMDISSSELRTGNKDVSNP